MMCGATIELVVDLMQAKSLKEAANSRAASPTPRGLGAIVGM